MLTATHSSLHGCTINWQRIASVGCPGRSYLLPSSSASSLHQIGHQFPFPTRQIGIRAAFPGWNADRGSLQLPVDPDVLLLWPLSLRDVRLPEPVRALGLASQEAKDPRDEGWNRLAKWVPMQAGAAAHGTEGLQAISTSAHGCAGTQLSLLPTAINLVQLTSSGLSLAMSPVVCSSSPAFVGICSRWLEP